MANLCYNCVHCTQQMAYDFTEDGFDCYIVCVCENNGKTIYEPHHNYRDTRSCEKYVRNKKITKRAVGRQ